jgi:hypothetical protein
MAHLPASRRFASSTTASAASALAGSLAIAAGGGGLDHHQAHVVGHHVVQFASDAGALVEHLLVGKQQPLALGTLGTLHQLGVALATTADVVTQHHRTDEHHRRGEQGE